MTPIGIIIQARTGSTRMPEKVILPFYQGKSILDLLIEKLKILQIPTVLATTINPSDDRICQLAENHRISCFRGSEDDVLDRFVQAARYFHFEKVIRVCADNPFLDRDALSLLVHEFGESEADYLGFELAGNQPSILTHFGFWAEAVRFDALQKVQKLTDERLYHEHVTNFIYKSPALFQVRFIPADPVVFNRTDIRLTLDTPEDFEIQKQIYASLLGENPNFAVPEIVSWLDRHPEILNRMKQEINKNQK